MFQRCVSFVVLSVWLLSVFLTSCAAIKCFECNSANNSACLLDMRSPRALAIIPAVDCAGSLPNAISKDFFCRKIIQTILHADKSPEVRVTRGCGWVRHKRACYTADNEGHLETVCQCFGDRCNAAGALANVKVTVTVTVLAVIASLVVAYKS